MFSLLRRPQHFPAIHLSSAARLMQTTYGFPGVSTVSGAISFSPPVSGILLLAAPATSALARCPLSVRSPTARTVVTSAFPLVSTVSGAVSASPPISGIVLIESPATSVIAPYPLIVRSPTARTVDPPGLTRSYSTSGDGSSDSPGNDSSGGYEFLGTIFDLLSEMCDAVIKSADMSSAAIMDFLPDMEYLESVLTKLSTYLLQLIKGVMKEKFMKMSDDLARKLLDMLLEKGFQKLAEITGLLERKFGDTKQETKYFYFNNVHEVHIQVTVNNK